MSSPSLRKQLQSGVSLVEMLVCVGIIGLLASLLVPGLGKYIEGARGARCSGNLKQLGAVFYAYSIDNDGKIPAASTPSAGNPKKVDQNRISNWYGELGPYYDRVGLTPGLTVAKIYEIMNCPTFWVKFKNKHPGWIGYGMNTHLRITESTKSNYKSLDTSASRQNMGALPNPSRTILVGETTALNIDIGDLNWKFTKNPSQFEGWDINGTPDRHNGHSNYLFVDGHVETLSLDSAQLLLTPGLEEAQP